MSDDNHPYLDGSAAKSWCPSSALRGRLLLGAAAALTFGGLAAAAVLGEQAQAQGFTPGRISGLFALVALAGVLWTYLGIGRAVDSSGLRGSSRCALGVVFLWALLGMEELDLLPAGSETPVLVGIAAALIALLISAFHSPGKSASVDKNSASPAGSKAGWGGVGIALLLFAKIGLRFLLGFGIKGGGWEVLVLVSLIVSTIGFFLWFGVCKTRLADKLGGFAAFVGVAEILGLIAGTIFVVYVLIGVHEASEQPGFDANAENDLVVHWKHMSIWTLASANVAWGSLTALLFLTLWSRHDPDADWLSDLQHAEQSYRPLA